MALFWMRATGSGTANPSVTRVGGGAMHLRSMKVSGVRTTGDPWDTTPVTSVTATTSPSVAGFTAAVDTLLLMVLGHSRDIATPGLFSAYANATDPLTWTEQWDISSTNGNGIGQGGATAPSTSGRPRHVHWHGWRSIANWDHRCRVVAAGGGGWRERRAGSFPERRIAASSCVREEGERLMADRVYTVSFTEVAVPPRPSTSSSSLPATTSHLKSSDCSSTSPRTSVTLRPKILPYRAIRGHATTGTGGASPTPRPCSAVTPRPGSPPTRTTRRELLAGPLSICTAARSTSPSARTSGCQRAASGACRRPTALLVIRSASAPADSIDLSGTMYVREQG